METALIGSKWQREEFRRKNYRALNPDLEPETPITANGKRGTANGERLAEMYLIWTT